MKKTEHRQIMARISVEAGEALDREKRRTGATITWLLEHAILRTYGDYGYKPSAARKEK